MSKMMKSKWTGGMVCACLLAALMVLPAVAHADAREEDERLDARKQWWYVLENGEATITGCVEDVSGELAIPREVDGFTVTGIGGHAFEGRRNLISVTIPASVTRIGDGAFADCFNLTDVPIPEGVAHIGDGAFEWCGLTSVTIPASLTSMGWNPFQSCPLKSIDVSSDNPAYEAIHGVLFDKQRKILIAYPVDRKGSYKIPKGVLSIGDYAFFAPSGLTRITIPDSVTDIGNWAFYACVGLGRISIPDGVTSIGDYAFYECERLANVTIPDSVRHIGQGAFSSCRRFTRMAIPASVTSMGSNPFGSTPLKSIGVSPDNPMYEAIDGVLFDKRQKMLVSYPDARKGPYAVPDGTVLIGDRAFAGCDNLTSVTIPDSVTSIGVYAFQTCTRLTSVTIPSSVTSIGDYAFAANNGLLSVVIPNSVTSIGDAVFVSCHNLALSVIAGSYAERYAKDNRIPYTFQQ